MDVAETGTCREEIFAGRRQGRSFMRGLAKWLQAARETPPLGAHDPHGDVRATVAARTQKSDFLDANGSVVDVCGGLPCHTDVFTP
jgi:hypothetical protein